VSAIVYVQLDRDLYLRLSNGSCSRYPSRVEQSEDYLIITYTYGTFCCYCVYRLLL